MQITFVSNYINHHQIPFCEEMIKLCGEHSRFTFIQTEEIAGERLNMGWGAEVPDFVKCSYTSKEDDEACRKLIMDSEVVIFGGCEDESYIQPRLEAGKFTFRYSERVYKEGQWKWISPRGLKKKYHDHTRHNNAPVYLLCSGGYVASDFSKFGAYKNKMYKWGYFPAVKEYDDIEALIEAKGYIDTEASGDQKIPYILWAGRFLDCKHPELAIETARFLKECGFKFHMDMIGNGPQEKLVNELYDKYELSDVVTLKDFLRPEEVRTLMEKADIYLFTSDRNEGWGAVLNESMNSGCAVVADNMIGATPYLIKHGINGWAFRDNHPEEFFNTVKRLVGDKKMCQKNGRNAYETIIKIWNPSCAAISLWRLIGQLYEGENESEVKHICDLQQDDKRFEGVKSIQDTDAGNSTALSRPCMREYPKAEKKIANEIFSYE